MQAAPPRVAVIGAGWAGLAAAVAAQQAGMQVCVFEAAREPGGRARNVSIRMPHATEAAPALAADTSVLEISAEPTVALDNGQHILIGAYRASLALMRTVGVVPEQSLSRLPLDLRDVNGQGLVLPAWPPALQPLAGAWGIANAKGWSWPMRWAMLRQAVAWQRQGFQTDANTTVAQLCRGLPSELIRQFIEPLCIAALNTPITQASGQVFLRILQDSLAGGPGSADLLLPTQPLGAVLAKPACEWLQAQGAQVLIGQRVERLIQHPPAAGGAPQGVWELNDQRFDAVILACPVWEAARLIGRCLQEFPIEPVDRPSDVFAEGDGALPSGKANAQGDAQHWLDTARQLHYEAIGTVYLCSDVPEGAALLPRPMLAVHDGPAQFVFDRQQLTGNCGMTAWVASTLEMDKEALTQAVLAQAGRLQQALVQQGEAPLVREWQHVATVIEKRATFRCVAGLMRPSIQVDRAWPTLLACGDYTHGPYPATLEGAVLSGQEAAARLHAVWGMASFSC